MIPSASCFSSKPRVSKLFSSCVEEEAEMQGGRGNRENYMQNNLKNKPLDTQINHTTSSLINLPVQIVWNHFSRCKRVTPCSRSKMVRSTTLQLLISPKI